MNKRGNLTRRDFLRLSAVAATGVVLGACRPAVTPAPKPVEKPAEKPVEEKKPAPPTEKVTIHWWTGWSAEPLGEVAAKFSELNPNITVNWLGGVDQEKFLTALAGGEPPDAASLGAYPELFSKGVAMDLTDWINASKAFDPKDIFEASWKGATYKGKIYAFPGIEGFTRYGLCFNVDLVKEAGLDVANPPQTWDEAFEWHKALTKFDAAGNVSQVGLDPLDAMGGSIGFGDPWMWPKSWDFDYYDDENLKYNIDNPNSVEFFGVIKKFYDLVDAKKMAAFRQSYGTWTGPQASFCTGVQAMQINGYWTPGEMAHNAPTITVGYSWIPVPARRKGKKVQSMGGHYVFIPEGAKHPEAAFQFGEFTMGDTACDIIYNGLGWLPSRKSYLEKADISKYKGLDWFVRSVAEADELTEVEMDPITQITGNEWDKNTQAVIYGDKTPEQAVKDMQAKLTEELAKAQLK